jgi:hypothetical protein
MKKYTMMGVASFFLVVFFQNCGKPPATTDSTSQVGVTTSNQQYNKYSAEGFSTLSLWDYLQNRYLDLNLKTGQMVAFEEGGQVAGQTYQLPADKLAEVQNLLKEAQVCEPVINPAELEGRVCTMAYRYPYAVLVEKGEEIRLGEKTDGCDVPVDLCGDQASQLQSWTRSVVEHL